MEDLLELLREEFKKKIDTQERNIYIVAGVLGGIDLLLIILTIVLCYLIWQLKKQMREAEVKKQVEEQMNAQKFAAYTGEELHRKLLAVSNPAVPLSQTGRSGGPDSEYAFNSSFVDNRALGTTPTPNGIHPPGSISNRFSRY